MELGAAYDFVTRSFYLRQMSPLDAAKLFRETADVLDMIVLASDERQRRILHDLFEENEAQAEFLERLLQSYEGFETFRIARRMN